MIWLACAGSAALLYLSFSNVFDIHGFAFWGWLFAIPFFWSLEQGSFRKKLLLGAVWGITAYGALVHWVVPVSRWGYCLFTFTLALQGVIFAMLAGCGPRNDHGRLLYYPCAWVVSEGLRNIVLGGFTWHISYALAFVPSMIQLAAWGGAAAVSWCMIFVNTAFFVSIKRGIRRDRTWMLGIGMLVVLWAAGHSVLVSGPRGQRHVRVGAVQANIDHAQKKDPRLYDQNIERHVQLTQGVMDLKTADIIVWPETSFVDDVLQDPEWKFRIEQLAQRSGSYLLVGSALQDNDREFNSALLITPQGQWKDVYHKHFLVPFSEYAPTGWLSRFVLLAAGNKGYHFSSGRRSGLMFLDPVKAGHHTEAFGVMICSEEGYPGLFRRIAQQGAGFFVVMLNDGWFAAPQALMMHARESVFRAVETGRPVIRVANTGWTAGFDGAGRKMPSGVDLQRAGSAVFDVNPQQGVTGYMKFGEFLVWLCAGFVIMTLIGVCVLRYQTVTLSGSTKI